MLAAIGSQWQEIFSKNTALHILGYFRNKRNELWAVCMCGNSFTPAYNKQQQWKKWSFRNARKIANAKSQTMN